MQLIEKIKRKQFIRIVDKREILLQVNKTAGKEINLA